MDYLSTQQKLEMARAVELATEKTFETLQVPGTPKTSMTRLLTAPSKHDTVPGTPSMSRATPPLGLFTATPPSSRFRFPPARSSSPLSGVPAAPAVFPSSPPTLAYMAESSRAMSKDADKGIVKASIEGPDSGSTVTASSEGSSSGRDAAPTDGPMKFDDLETAKEPGEMSSKGADAQDQGLDEETGIRGPI